MQSKVAIVGSGIIVNRPSVQYFVNLVTVPRPARSVVAAGVVVNPARQVWGSPPSADVFTNVSIDLDDSSISDSAIVIEDDRVPEDNSPVPELSANLPVDPVKVMQPADPGLGKSPDTVAVKVSDNLPANNDVSKSQSSLSFVTAKVFCTRLSKNFVPLPFPNFNVTDKEWDSKAKAHLRLCLLVKSPT